jgi:hypothetical protein
VQLSTQPSGVNSQGHLFTLFSACYVALSWRLSSHPPAMEWYKRAMPDHACTTFFADDGWNLSAFDFRYHRFKAKGHFNTATQLSTRYPEVGTQTTVVPNLHES